MVDRGGADGLEDILTCLDVVVGLAFAQLVSLGWCKLMLEVRMLVTFGEDRGYDVPASGCLSR